jgi:DNA polymerase III epsilon subunit-like protein
MIIFVISCSCERDVFGELRFTWVFWVILFVIIIFLSFVFLSKSKINTNSLSNGDNPKNLKMNLSFECEEDESKYNGYFLFVSIKTTGLPIDINRSKDDLSNWPHIIQISWLVFNEDRKLIEREDHIIMQNLTIPERIIEETGISNEIMIEKGELPEAVFSMFNKAIKDVKIFVAHNIEFTNSILHAEMYRNNIPFSLKNKEIVCTMESSSDYCGIKDYEHEDFKYPKLLELLEKCFYQSEGSVESLDLLNAKMNVHIIAKCFFYLVEKGIIKSKLSLFESTILKEKKGISNSPIDRLLILRTENIPDRSYSFVGKSQYPGYSSRYFKILDFVEFEIFETVELHIKSDGKKRIVFEKSMDTLIVRQIDKLLKLFSAEFGSDCEGKSVLTRREISKIKNGNDSIIRVWKISDDNFLSLIVDESILTLFFSV